MRKFTVLLTIKTKCLVGKKGKRSRITQNQQKSSTEFYDSRFEWQYLNNEMAMFHFNSTIYMGRNI